MSNEQFVKEWLSAYKTGGNQSAIAENLKISRQQVSQKATYLRKKGVKLPVLKNGPKGLSKIDVEKLNYLIMEEQSK